MGFFFLALWSGMCTGCVSDLRYVCVQTKVLGLFFLYCSLVKAQGVVPDHRSRCLIHMCAVYMTLATCLTTGVCVCVPELAVCLTIGVCV